MKKLLLLGMILLMMTSVSAMVYTQQYSKLVSTTDKASCNPMMNTDCRVFRDYLEVNYFDDARFFDESGTKTGFLSKLGGASYKVEVYWKYFDEAFYSTKISNINTTCIIWHNIYEIAGDVNFTTAYQYVFVFGGGNVETLQKFYLKGGETLQCFSDATYVSTIARHLTMPIRTDVFDSAYELQDENQCSNDVTLTQEKTSQCRASIAGDTSQANPSAMLYLKKLVYYTDYGMNILYIIIDIGLTIGVIFLLFSFGFILYKVIKREMK